MVEKLLSIIDKTISLLNSKNSLQVLESDKTCKHLLNISYRLENSKKCSLMIVGDLNSGKSTLVNALSREKIVPMDQQPCTCLFMELSASLSKEIHLLDSLLKYSSNDSSTFTKFELEELQRLNSTFTQESFLKVLHSDLKGIFLKLQDISIIDSPGLNIDSWTTMKLVQKHQEIDVLVYVISAENHLTQSGKEFLEMAVKEKLHIFIIINRFDQISQKEKCKSEILKQIQEVLPNTFSIGQELIHFISAKEFLDQNSCNSKDSSDLSNFRKMEESLVDFLKKRNLSKLLPAKTFLQNVYKDSKTRINQKITNLQNQKEELTIEINQNHPTYIKMVLLKSQFLDNVDSKIEEIAKSVQIYSKNSMNELLQDFELLFESVEFEGIVYTWYYANRLCRLSGLLSRKRIKHCLLYAKQESIKYIEPLYSSVQIIIPDITIDMDLVVIDETLTNDDIIIPQIDLSYYDVLALDRMGSIFLPLVGVFSSGLYTLNHTIKNSFIYHGSIGGMKSIAASISIAGAGVLLFIAFYDIKGRLQRKIKEKISVEYGQSRFIEDSAEDVAMKTRKVLRSSLWALQSQYTTCYAKNSTLLESLKHKHTLVQKNLDVCMEILNQVTALERSLEDVILDLEF